MDVVEVVLSWGTTVLAVEQVRAGRGLALGEQGDLVLPVEIVGAERVEIVRYDEDTATVLVPERAHLRVDGRDVLEKSVELARGQLAELAVGPFVEPRANEHVEHLSVRFRTVGDATCTGAVISRAGTLEAIINEVALANVSERGATRADDKFSETAMEDRKREGYF